VAFLATIGDIYIFFLLEGEDSRVVMSTY